MNILGTFNLLESSENQVKSFIFASSGATLGEVEPPMHEKIAPHPIFPYGASKLAGEGYCNAYHHSFGIDTVALRFGNVYGPDSGRKNSVVAKFIRQALNGETLEIYGDGKQTRDFIYIDDLVNAVQLAATVKGNGGEIFQIATNKETTVGEMAEELLVMLSDAGCEGVEIRHGGALKGDVRRKFSATTKARELLG